MEIGRTIPRHQTMALLYPRSKALQAQIHEYFIIVVRLCTRMMTLSQQSKLKRLTSTLSSADLKSTQSELNAWAASIKNETDLQMAKTVEEEANQNSRSRLLSLGLSKAFSYEQRISERLRVLDLCSKLDYETPWRQLRKAGSTDRFAGTSEYLDWKNSTTSTSLIYAGHLGCGKSVMFASIVDDIHFQMTDTRHLIAYLFCTHDVPESLRARAIVGTLVRQLLQFSAPDTAFPSIRAGNMDQNDMLLLLEATIDTKRKSTIVLDGLDLCEENERQDVTNFIAELQKRRFILVCISSRVGSGAEPRALSGTLIRSSVVVQPDNGSDISTFVTTELERRLETGELIIGDPSLILEIRDALVKGSQGMFLWVALLIQSLSTLHTDAEIRSALEDLPADMPGVYHRILQSAAKRAGITYQRNILAFLVAAKRRLTTNELREALSITPGHTQWTPAQLVNDINLLLSCCGCLVCIDEEELTVRLVHPSVKQFIQTEYRDSTGQSLTGNQAENIVAQVVLTYVNLAAFETALVRTSNGLVAPKVDASSLLSSVTATTKSTQLALKLLRSNQKTEIDIGQSLRRPTGLSSQKQDDQTTYQFRFREYTLSLGLYHILLADSLDDLIIFLPKVFSQDYTQLQELLSQLPNIKHTTDDLPQLSATFLLNGSTFMHLVVLFDNFYLLRNVSWRDEAGDINDQNAAGWTPLMFAVQMNRATMVGEIVSTMKVQPEQRSATSTVGIAAALELTLGTTASLYPSICQVCERFRVERESRNTLQITSTPLTLAITWGYTDIVEILLRHVHTSSAEHESYRDNCFVDLNRFGAEKSLRPLWLAVRLRSEDKIIRMLIDAGVAVQKEEEVQELLDIAAPSQKSMIQLVLIVRNQVRSQKGSFRLPAKHSGRITPY